MLIEVYVVSIKNELTFLARSLAYINKPPLIKSNFDEVRVNINAFLTLPKWKWKETPPHSSHEAGITDMPTVGKNTTKRTLENNLLMNIKNRIATNSYKQKSRTK